jgi:hypothetical protein
MTVTPQDTTKAQEQPKGPAKPAANKESPKVEELVHFVCLTAVDAVAHPLNPPAL